MGSSSIGSVDVIGRFGSLHIAGLAKVQGGGFVTASVAPLPAVPEPSTYALMLLGLAALGVAARRRRRAAEGLSAGGLSKGPPARRLSAGRVACAG